MAIKVSEMEKSSSRVTKSLVTDEKKEKGLEVGMVMMTLAMTILVIMMVTTTKRTTTTTMMIMTLRRMVMMMLMTTTDNAWGECVIHHPLALTYCKVRDCGFKYIHYNQYSLMHLQVNHAGIPTRHS